MGLSSFMSSPDLVDRRARRCVTGYAEDEDEDNIDDAMFSDNDCNAFTVQQCSSSSGDCSEEKDLQSRWHRRRCFDGWSPLGEEGFSDDDELFSAVDSIVHQLSFGGLLVGMMMTSPPSLHKMITTKQLR